MKPIPYKRFLPLLYAALLLSAAWLLLYDLRADSPGDIDQSAGMVFDPPSKCQTARNRVLYGEWRTDEWTPYIHGALHTLIQTAAFRLGGVNMITMRLPGALLFGIALALSALLAFQRRDHLAGLTVLVLGIFNPIFWAYGRSGLLEPQLIGWVLISAWALGQAWRAKDTGHSRAIYFFLAGLTAAAAFWTKLMGIYYVVPALAMVLIAPPGRRRDTLYFFVPLILAIVLYIGPFMAANQSFFERETSYWVDRAQVANHWALWSRQPVFHQLGRSRWLVMLGLLAIPLTWRRYRNPTDAPAALRALGLTLLIGLQATAFIQYRPLRYSILPVFAALPLAAWLIGQTFQWARQDSTSVERIPHARRNPLLWLIGLLMLTYSFNFGILYPWAAEWRTYFTLPVHWRLALSAFVAFFLLWAGRGLTPWIRRVSPRTRTILLALAWTMLWAPITLSNARELRLRVKSGEHQMVNFSKQLGEEYRDMMIAGTSPAFAGVENTHSLRKVTHYGLNNAVMHDPALTHLLIPDAWGQPEFFKRKFPEVWARARVMDRIVISGFSHSLYALDRQPPRVEQAEDELIVINPDPHSPAYVTLIAETPAEGTVWVPAFHTLLPGARWAPDVEGPFRLMERVEWRTPGKALDALRLAWKTDSTAWEHRSLQLGSNRSSKNKRPGAASWTIQHDQPIALIGLRLRADPDKVGDIRCVWMPDEGTEWSWTVPATFLQEDHFTPVCVALPESAQGKNGRLRVEVEGVSPLWLNQILVLSR